MDSKKKLVEKGKRLYQRFVNNVGKKNYEKLLKENPEEYDIGYNSPKKIKQLIKQAEENKANVYKGYTIPMKYKNKTWNEYLKNHTSQRYNDYDNKNTNAVAIHIGRTSINKKDVGEPKQLDNPITRYFNPMLNNPVAINKFVLGHELGHAKDIYDKQSLLPKIRKAQKNNNIHKTNKLIKKYDELRNRYNKINIVNGKKMYLLEELADKNVPKFLKQIKVPKKDRQAIYYMKKNLYPHQGMRYRTKYGNLKYLKDYIFGFSLLPEGYHLYKPMTQVWKDMMREHFCNIYFSVGEYIASIKDFKNREKERTGKTLNDTDLSLRTSLEWRKYVYGEGKASKLHQDLEYTSKYRDNPEIMNIYKAGKHEGIAEAIRMLQNAGIFSDGDPYFLHIGQCIE